MDSRTVDPQDGEGSGEAGGVMQIRMTGPLRRGRPDNTSIAMWITVATAAAALAVGAVGFGATLPYGSLTRHTLDPLTDHEVRRAAVATQTPEHAAEALVAAAEPLATAEPQDEKPVHSVVRAEIPTYRNSDEAEGAPLAVAPTVTAAAAPGAGVQPLRPSPIAVVTPIQQQTYQQPALPSNAMGTTNTPPGAAPQGLVPVVGMAPAVSTVPAKTAGVAPTAQPAIPQGGSYQSAAGAGGNLPVSSPAKPNSPGAVAPPPAKQATPHAAPLDASQAPEPWQVP